MRVSPAKESGLSGKGARGAMVFLSADGVTAWWWVEDVGGGVGVGVGVGGLAEEPSQVKARLASGALSSQQRDMAGGRQRSRIKHTRGGQVQVQVK